MKIRVKQSLKGPLSHHEIIEIGSAYTDCNLTYDKRKEYLLFLEKKGRIYEEQGCTKSGVVKSDELLITQVKQAVRKACEDYSKLIRLYFYNSKGRSKVRSNKE